MPTTNYICTHGMVWGEISDTGVTRSYGHDALGSVTETFVNGALENTYRYKPYGGLLAKTGTGADPRFLWNGGSGYRTTTLPQSSYYVRRRHYSNISALWTSGDPVWPTQPLLVYVASDPVNGVDPSGMCRRQQTIRTGTCHVYKGNTKIGDKDMYKSYVSIDECTTCADEVKLWWIKIVNNVDGSGFGCANVRSTSGSVKCGPEKWQELGCDFLYGDFNPITGIMGGIGKEISRLASGRFQICDSKWTNAMYIDCELKYIDYEEENHCSASHHIGTTSGH